ncbi:MAG TPA: hypothetical protein VFX61_07025 [Micromonosporaceae bacterium]|nr:hypothetical protein [Micromonosporaceae bacterium]
MHVEPLVETYADLARRILARPPRLGRTRLVAVDGPSGAGKTSFAARLAVALAAATPPVPDSSVPVVRTDDLLDGWADQFTFWPRLDEWVLAPLRAGQPGRYRRYDWGRGRFTPHWIPVPPAPVLILEGVSSARRMIRPELTMAVFVTAPAALRQARALARDGSALLPYLEEWWRREEVHFAADATRKQAELVVNGAPAELSDPTGSYIRLR